MKTCQVFLFLTFFLLTSPPPPRRIKVRQLTGNRGEPLRSKAQSTEGASLGWQAQAKLSGKRTRFLLFLWKVFVSQAV